MSNFNYGSKIETEVATGGIAHATADAVSGRQFQVVEMSGSAKGGAGDVVPTKLELLFGSTVKYTLHYPTDNIISVYFGENGPVSATNEAVTVRVTPVVGGTAGTVANLVYRVLV